jgi:hypothetical protein
MPQHSIRFFAVCAVVVSAIAAAAIATPSFAQNQGAAQFCDLRSGHAWQVRRFLTSRVTLLSLEGERMASVSRTDLGDVTRAVQCDNTTTYVKLDTRFGPRLAPRTSLVLGGGIGPPCQCASVASNQHQSGSQRGASSMGAGEGAICNADLPCVR